VMSQIGYNCQANSGYECAGNGCLSPSLCSGPECTFAETAGTTSQPPSGSCPPCWEMVNGKCAAKQGADSCFILECDGAEIKYDFESTLFDVVDNASPTPFAAPNAPSFADGRWRSRCALGECGMTCESREVEGDVFMVFKVTVALRTVSQTMIDGMIVHMSNSRPSSMTFECAFKQEVKLTSDADFTVKSSQTYGQAIGFGDLTSNFRIALYKDASFTVEVGTSSNLYIGAPVYAQVKWNVPQVQQIVGFYLDKCYVTLNDAQSIDLINDNCYSKTFGAQQLTTTKIVENNAQFKFKSFMLGARARSMNLRMSCEVKLCSLAENKCQASLNNNDNQCPAIAGYQYKANTYLS
jgi:hypothetical protein